MFGNQFSGWREEGPGHTQDSNSEGTVTRSRHRRRHREAGPSNKEQTTYQAVEPADALEQPMASSTVGGLAYGTGASVLKAAHPEPFSGGSVKAKIFILQVDNKIADAAGASEGRKIRYAMSLLRGSAAEWAANYVTNTGEDTFQTYINFKAQFLGRFTDPNPSGTAVERLMNMKQGKQSIQEYCTKTLNLARQANLGDQAAKALIFRGFHPKDQERVMMANSLKSEEELVQETLEEYLGRTGRLLRREEVRRKAWFSIEKQYEGNKKASWGEGGDPMDLDMLKAKETRKCFKCGKAGHIRRFCRNKAMEVANVSDSENEGLLATEGSQEEEL